jgi:NAD(P)-dependent dehydrogenase (short-subunit alcohol dehydrogenase family)
MTATDGGEIVIVTGAGGAGCGRSIASRFGARGDAVVVSDIDESGGRQTVEAIVRAGGRAAFFRADVRADQQCRDLVAFASGRFGDASVLVNNASSNRFPPPGIEHWIEAIETDLLGTMHVTRWAIEAMRRRGRGSIVNISSISALWQGRTSPGGMPGYDVAKAGMIRMTTGLASLAGTDNIRVNCLAPGWIATDGPRQYWESLTPETRAERGVPSRLLSLEQVADAVVRLAGDATLAGRVVAWWSEGPPRLIAWGDRGYRDFEPF